MASALSAALDRLASESEQIARGARANDVPCGPFTTAFLSDVLLLRDSDESERQPFRKLLDDEYSGFQRAGPSNPKQAASMRASTDGGVNAPRKQVRDLMTPLRELPRKKGTPEELDATLTALTDIIASLNESFSLKRARKEARALTQRHHAQQGRIAELERLIEDASRRDEAPPSPTPEPEHEATKLSVEEAIVAEEEALAALEAALKPLREQAPRDDDVRSPLKPRQPTSPTTPVKTPTRSKALPVITNSLVQTPSRSGPMASTTPWQASAQRSAAQPRSIFGPPRHTMTPARMGPISALTPARKTPARTGFLATPLAKTPRAPVLSPVGEPDPTPIGKRDLEPNQAPPPPPRSPSPAAPVTSTEPATSMVDGVEVDHPAIVTAIDLLFSLTSLMRTGTSGAVDNTPAATVAHLVALSRRDPDSSASPPITTDVILLSHMILMLLRQVRTGRDLAETFVPLPELKSDLGAVARARGWDALEDVANKIVYHAVGLKIARIDRRGRGGPKMRFTGM